MPGLEDLTKSDDAGAADTLAAPPSAAKADSTSLTDLTGGDKGTLGLPESLTKGLVGVEKERIARTRSAEQEMLSRTERDRTRLQEQYAATAVQPGDFPKWNAEAEHEKHATDPLVAFGSLGSVFGMIASAFTHAPVENALNASAAAMNAIKAGDEKEYERSHEAWKQNTDLAFKRHQIERERYSDALHLFDTDMTLGAAKMKMVASQSNDQKVMLLLENQMYPELWALMQQRNDAAVGMYKAANELDGEKTKREFLKKLYAQNEEQYKDKPEELAGANQAAAVAASFINAKDVDHQMLGMWQVEQRKKTGKWPTSDETLNKLGEIETANRGGISDMQRQFVAKRMGEIAAEHPDWAPAQSEREATREWNETKNAGKAGTAGGKVTLSGQHAQTLEGLKEDVAKEHPEWSKGQVGAEAEHRQKQAQTTVSGNKQLELQGRIDKFEHSEQIVDKTLKVLENHNAAAGIAGKVMRLEERISNIVGSKSTDRVQMMRDIELLRGWGKELLFSKNEKLKAEASRIDSIVGGTSAGDTGPNTVRALKDLKKLYEQMKQEEEAKLKGTWKPSEEREPSTSKPAGGKMPWDNLPIKKRSDIAPSEEAA